MEVNALTRWGSFAAEMNRLGNSFSSEQLAEIRKKFHQLSKDRELQSFTSSLQRKLEEDAAKAENNKLGLPSKNAKVSLMKLLRYFLKRFAKGFVIGFLLKAIFNFLPYAIRTRMNPSKLAKIFVQKFNHLLGAEPISFGAFLGTFLGISEYLLRVLSRSHHPILRVLRGPIAGAIAAFGFLWMPKSYRPTLSIFFLVRAMELFIKWLCILGFLPTIEHADAWTMVLASSEILWAWMYAPDALDPSYMRFLNNQGGKPRDMVESFAGFCDYSNSKNIDGLINIKSFASMNEKRIEKGLGALELTNLNPRDTFTLQPMICEFLHEKDYFCFFHFLRFVKEGYLRALPVYIPVYLIPLVIFKYKSLFKAPLKVLSSTAANIAQSALFLSTYCGLAWYSTCLLRNYAGIYTSGRFIGHAAGLSGLAVLLEKKPRRIELALYVMSQAIKAFLTANAIHLPYIPHMDFYAFLFSSMVIVTTYAEHPEIMRPSYRSLLNYFFGSSKRSMRRKLSEHEENDKYYRKIMHIPEPSGQDGPDSEPNSPKHADRQKDTD